MRIPPQVYSTASWIARPLVPEFFARPKWLHEAPPQSTRFLLEAEEGWSLVSRWHTSQRLCPCEQLDVHANSTLPLSRAPKLEYTPSSCSAKNNFSGRAVYENEGTAVIFRVGDPPGITIWTLSVRLIFGGCGGRGGLRGTTSNTRFYTLVFFFFFFPPLFTVTWTFSNSRNWKWDFCLNCLFLNPVSNFFNYADMISASYQQKGKKRRKRREGKKRNEAPTFGTALTRLSIA